MPATLSREKKLSRENRALSLVSVAVLCGASTWLSGTAVAPILETQWNLDSSEMAWLTISVQLGFVLGTIIYAALNLADIFSARFVFMMSAWGAAIFNAGFGWIADSLQAALFFRFLTGLTLAGVYPVGMKIVASWFRSGLGWRLGIMVGALALGSASPYLLKGLVDEEKWRDSVLLASLASCLGGALVGLFVPQGPHLPMKASKFDLRMMGKVFRHPPFRFTAFGYFGHMWELYAFWSFVTFYMADVIGGGGTFALWGFAVVGMGSLGCVVCGFWSKKAGERRVATLSLAMSGAACLLSWCAPWVPDFIVFGGLLIWGFFVVSDSPQFSALAAKYAPKEYTGTALTVQNGVGFLITVFALQLLPLAANTVGWRFAMILLLPGPLFGLWAMKSLHRYELRALDAQEAQPVIASAITSTSSP